MTTPTQKQLCIAEQLFYGLKIQLSYGKDKIEKVYSVERNPIIDLSRIGAGSYDDELITNVKPILRPMSDLYRRIKHKGYNNDKSFIPIIKLAEIATDRKRWKVVEDSAQIEYKSGNGRCFYYQNGTFHHVFYEENEFHKDLRSLSDEVVTEIDTLFDLLNLWHFDRRNLIASGDAIDANTLIVNPYTV